MYARVRCAVLSSFVCWFLFLLNLNSIKQLKCCSFFLHLVGISFFSIWCTLYILLSIGYTHTHIKAHTHTRTCHFEVQLIYFNEIKLSTQCFKWKEYLWDMTNWMKDKHKHDWYIFMCTQTPTSITPQKLAGKEIKLHENRLIAILPFKHNYYLMIEHYWIHNEWTTKNQNVEVNTKIVWAVFQSHMTINRKRWKINNDLNIIVHIGIFGTRNWI